MDVNKTTLNNDNKQDLSNAEEPNPFKGKFKPFTKEEIEKMKSMDMADVTEYPFARKRD